MVLEVWAEVEKVLTLELCKYCNAYHLEGTVCPCLYLNEVKSASERT